MSDEVKKIEVSQRLFCLLVVLLAGVLCFWAVKVWVDLKGLPENYPREISVSAQGKTFFKPDVALVEIGVKTEGMKVGDVVKENTEKMNAVLAEIKNLGVEEKDIQTSQYDLSPEYDYPEKGERIFRGYALTNQVQVKIRNFEKIGEVLDAATQKGANLVGDLQFTIDESEKVTETARNQAIEKAKAKANQIASQAGLKLVGLINVYESSYSAPSYKESALGAGGEVSATPTIQPGEEEVTVTITLVYRVR